MDWAKLVSDNFAAITGLLGFLLGAVVTYLVQSRLQERQHKWALDNQKRQWRKDRMERRFEPLRLYVRDTLNLMQLRHHAEDPDLKKAYHTQRRDRTVRRSEVQSNLAASVDDRLEELFKRLDQNFDAWLNAFDKKDGDKMLELEQRMKGSTGLVAEIHKRMDELQERRL